MNKIKVYTMHDCPDCIELKKRLSDKAEYEFIDIGEKVSCLKEFLSLRDSRKEFDEIRKTGAIGIPCLLFPDGHINFPESESQKKSFCSIDGKGC